MFGKPVIGSFPQMLLYEVTQEAILLEQQMNILIDTKLTDL